MKNTVHLDAPLMKNLAGCKVGDSKTLSVPVRVTRYGKDGAEFEVTSAPTIEHAPATEEVSPPSDEGSYAPGVEQMMARRSSGTMAGLVGLIGLMGLMLSGCVTGKGWMGIAPEKDIDAEDVSSITVTPWGHHEFKAKWMRSRMNPKGENNYPLPPLLKAPQPTLITNLMGTTTTVTPDGRVTVEHK